MAKKILSLFLLVLLLSTMSCEKWRNNRETITSEDHTLAEACFNDMIRYSLLATSPVGQLFTDSCFTIQHNGSTFPQTIIIDFGNTECEGIFGNAMQGRVVIVLNDSLHLTGATAALTPENLYSNNYLVDGEVTITNTGLNSFGYPTYDVEVENGVITAQQDRSGENFTTSWTCSYHHELIEKNGIVMIDDLYRITGTASGINREQRNFTAEIKEPLQKYLNCRWPGGGVTKIAPDDLKERDLDYGSCGPNSNCCDNEAMENVRWTDPTVEMK